MKAIDFHTHAFPDNLAERAIKGIEEKSGIKAFLDGTIPSLLSSMDKNNIEKSVICSIATKPEQFESILKWSRKIRSERIIPFMSIHPSDNKFKEHIEIIKKEGFKGIKLHPYYQEFNLDEEKMFSVYETICKNGLILIAHTGYDFAFPPVKRAEPERVMKIKKKFPGLKFVISHLGGWREWKDVQKLLCGEKIYMEISFSLQFIDKKTANDIINSCSENLILFGSDSPWGDQGQTISLLKSLGLGKKKESLIFNKNALKLLT
ncbi:MAG: amidohydrolase family protein [Candidatus Omnitrophica bacterium]|nr:amidohydrolase family protein [Candidatus Omnitrophota bacterium]